MIDVLIGTFCLENSHPPLFSDRVFEPLALDGGARRADAFHRARRQRRHLVARVDQTGDQACRGRGDPPPQLVSIKRRLYDVRKQRVWPGLDDKRLTSWNALMIAALAEAGAVLERPDYVDAAVACAEFVLRDLRDPDGRSTAEPGTIRPPRWQRCRPRKAATGVTSRPEPGA